MKTCLLLGVVLVKLAQCDPCGSPGEVFLSVYVDDASVKDKDTPGKSDPYCIVSAGGHDKKTKTKNNDNHPNWREMLDLGCVDPLVTTIRVDCYDDDGGFNKDDELLDEALTSQEWYIDGVNGQAYRLGGSKHNVDIEVHWEEAPTSAPTSAPTVSPTLHPTSVAPTLKPTTSKPSKAPTWRPTTHSPTTDEPTVNPTGLTYIAASEGLRSVQFTDSLLYDTSSDLACYDSPRLNSRIQLTNVRTFAASSQIFLTSSEESGPWTGMRLESSVQTVEDAECFSAVRGVVVEVDGETALSKAVFFDRNETCSSEIVYTPILTGDLAGEGCGSPEKESLEGVPVVTTANLEATVVDRNYVDHESLLYVDDGSGPALAVVAEDIHKNTSLNVGDSLVISDFKGIVVYQRFPGASSAGRRRLQVDSPIYAVRTTVFNFVKVGNFTEVPSPMPSPQPTTPVPSSAPTPRPSPAPSAKPTTRPTDKPSESPTAVPTKGLQQGGGSTSSSDDSSSAMILIFVVIFVIVLLCCCCGLYYRHYYMGIPRRPYDPDADRGTFEMGVVEAIAFDPNDPVAAKEQATAVVARSFDGEDQKEAAL